MSVALSVAFAGPREEIPFLYEKGEEIINARRARTRLAKVRDNLYASLRLFVTMDRVYLLRVSYWYTRNASQARSILESFEILDAKPVSKTVSPAVPKE